MAMALVEEAIVGGAQLSKQKLSAEKLQVQPVRDWWKRRVAGVEGLVRRDYEEIIALSRTASSLGDKDLN